MVYTRKTHFCGENKFNSLGKPEKKASRKDK
jgi:hypothetical protein